MKARIFFVVLLTDCSLDTFGDPDAAEDPRAWPLPHAVLVPSENDASEADAGKSDASQTDANPEADASTKNTKTIFVTSKDHAVTELLYVTPADAICQTAAQSGGLTGTFKAWLSSQSVSAASRLVHATEDYALPSGTVVAHGWTGLTSGSILAPLSEDESGAKIVTLELTWTGTAPNGAFSTGDDCGGEWSTNTQYWFGRVGKTYLTDYQWTSAGSDACNKSHRLVCVEQ